ncbi:MAG TPA: GTPase Era [Pelomicrobium sp.]|nr:GTPase Era [Pelomicrobium sp.]
MQTQTPAEAHRFGYVALLGRPNVGKSTLLNRLVGQKLSIVSNRPQTTRSAVRGIVTRADAQAVIVDTPGFQTQHRSALNRAMNRSVTQSLAGTDAVLFVLEAPKLTAEDCRVLELLPAGVPVVAAVNKIDRLADKGQLLPLMETLAAAHAFAEIVPVSAERDLGVEELLTALVKHLPEGEQLYAPDEITDASERFLAAELIREKLFRLLGEELPYASSVAIESFRDEPGLKRIHAVIYVEKASQKAIVIGRGGEKLKDVATRARLEMERLFGTKVFLEVWVKVRGGWRDDERWLRSHGLEGEG